ncbi:MAG: phage portal protein, partial [Brevinema sp.]
MKEKMAIILEDGGDIDWLIKQIDDGAMENYKNRLREDMHIFSNVPNMTDEAFGGNLSGVAVSYKLWGLEQVCAIKERKFKKALQRRIELIAHILNIQGGNYNYMDIEVQFRRNKPQNILEIAQIITMLSTELSRETRLKMLPTIENVQDELDKLQEEKQSDLNDYGNLGAFVKAFDTSKATAEEELTDEPTR